MLKSRKLPIHLSSAWRHKWGPPHCGITVWPCAASPSQRNWGFLRLSLGAVGGKKQKVTRIRCWGCRSGILSGLSIYDAVTCIPGTFQNTLLWDKLLRDFPGWECAVCPMLVYLKMYGLTPKYLYTTLRYGFWDMIMMRHIQEGRALMSRIAAL